MPRKKKPKQQARKPKTIEIDMLFNDNTILEADGQYDEVNRLMTEPPKKSSFKSLVAAPFPHDWNVKSNLSVMSPFGQGEMVLDFRSDRSVYIIEFLPSTVNGPDLSALMKWTQERGWKIPQPSETLIKDDQIFWKQMWETQLIDSAYFDNKFGLRKTLDMRETVDPDAEEL